MVGVLGNCVLTEVVSFKVGAITVRGAALLTLLTGVEHPLDCAEIAGNRLIQKF